MTFEPASDTDTVATGTGTTVRLAEPVMPSLVARMTEVPGFTPDTEPDAASTVATVVLELDQVMLRPVRTLPDESFVTAAACVFAPTKMLPEPRLTTTSCVDGASGATTVSAADPTMLSLVAEMVAEPAVTAEMAPDEALTEATAGLDEDQATCLPVRTTFAPFDSLALACVVCPTVSCDAASVT